MSKKILINVMHPEEARVAIVEDGRLVELDIEVAGSEQIRGNVYKGVVVRVEPGLQAAFLDIGLKKLGFLQMGELHPDCWQWRDDVPEENRKRRPRIQEVLRRGQELLVQVEKGERDMKGAALTTYCSLPGRYMVAMPGSDSAGISRKVEVEADRKKLKEMATQLEIPEGMGYIIRTEALGKSKTELNKDLKSLIKLHQEIKDKGAKTKAPALIYQEHDLVIRTIRDYFTAEIDEVLVDSPEVAKQAKAFFKRTMPKFENLVKLHQEKRPIFSKYQLEEQIDQIHEKKVLLKSGGSLVIEPTEALVSIDVNSGKSTGEKGVEDTAFKTNMEAAEEAARQLRLRDLGGLIVIDLIDMREKKHMIEVEKTLKNALKADKARVTVGRISQFGMLEMSRQRIKPTLSEATYLECPHCEGKGKVKSVENMAISFLRKVHGVAAKGAASEVRGNLPLEVAYYLLNRKKRELAQIEDDYEIEVTIKGKPSFLMNQLELEQFKREKPAVAEPPLELQAETKTVAEPAPDEEPENEDAAAPLASEEVKGKKKRRRKKKVKSEPEAAASEIPATAEEEAASGEPEAVAETSAPDETESEETPLSEEHKKKRRRRKRRGAKAHPAEAGGVEGAAAEPSVLPEDLPEVEAAPLAEDTVGVDGQPAEAHKKKRRRRKKRGAKGHSEESSVQTAEMSAVDLENPDSGVAKEAETGQGNASAEGQKKRRRRKRGGLVPADEPLAGPAAVIETVEAAAAEPSEKPAAMKKSRKQVKTKAPADFPLEAPLPGPPVENDGAAPKKRGGVRKQAAVATAEAQLPDEPAVPVQDKPPVKRAARRKKAVPSPEEGGA